MVTLGEITDRIGDGIHGTPEYDDNGEYYFFNGSNISNGHLSATADTKKINQSEYKSYKRELNDSTILLSINGTIGNLALYNGERCILGKSVAYINVKKGISRDFVYYSLMSRDFKNYISNANGSTIKNVSLDMLRNYSFELPDIKIQNNIAVILRTLENKIERNDKINDYLERICQLKYEELIEEFGSDETGIMSDVGTVIGGSTPSKSCPEYYSDNGIAWLTPKDLSEDKSKFIAKGSIDITDEGLKNSSAKIMPRGTILYSSRAPIGYIAISKNEITTNQGFKSIVPKKDCYRSFIYYYLKNNYDMIESLAGGSTFREISGSAMKELEVPIIDETNLEDFESFCSSIFILQEKLEEENRLLSATRDILLPKLMSGEIDVSSLSIE